METPLIGHIRQKIDSCIERAQQQGSLTLPSTVELAGICGASVKTVHRLIQEYQQQGKLIAIRGKGIFLPDKFGVGDDKLPCETGPEAPRTLRKWEVLRDRMISDIIEGSLQVSENTPGSKGLQQRYKANYRTCRKALRAALRTVGSDAAPALSAKHAVALGFFLHLQRGASLISSNPHMLAHVYRFEKHCLRRNLQFRMIRALDETGNPMPFDQLQLRKLAVERGILGWCTSVGRRADDEQCIAELRRTKKPVAIIDDTGVFAPAKFPVADPPTKGFRLGTGVEAPVRVGQYLWRLGHRHAAFISPNRTASWSRLREDKLMEFFRGNGGALYSHAHDYAATFAELNIEEWDSLMPELNYLTPGLPPPQRVHAESLTSWISAEAQQREESIDQQFQQILDAQSARKNLPNRVTAWICANDTCGIEALRFLERRKIRVPQDISIVSFDNSPDALAHNLTSYDFNYDAIAAAIVDFVIDPAAPHRPWRDAAWFEMEGKVVARGTTGSNPTSL